MNRISIKEATSSVAAWICAGACCLLLSGCAGATIASSVATSDSAKGKAVALNAELASAGLPSIPAGTAGALYGIDGGISCLNVAETQHRLGLAQFGNASGNVRRIIIDPTLIEYDRAVITTYCPQNLEGFEAEVAGLTTATTIP